MKDFYTDEEFAQLEAGQSRQPGIISDTQLGMRERIAAEQPSYDAEASKSLGRRFLSALPGEVAKTLVNTPAKFAASAIAAPIDIARGFLGKAPVRGERQTFQSEATDKFGGLYGKAYEGNLGKYEQLKGITPFAEVPLAGLETATLPGLAKSTTRGAGRLFKSTVGAISRTFSNRAEKKLISFAQELTSRPITKASKRHWIFT